MNWFYLLNGGKKKKAIHTSVHSVSSQAGSSARQSGSKAPPPVSEPIQQLSTTVQYQSTQAPVEPPVEPYNSAPLAEIIRTPPLNNQKLFYCHQFGKFLWQMLMRLCNLLHNFYLFIIIIFHKLTRNPFSSLSLRACRSKNCSTADISEEELTLTDEELVLRRMN